MTNALCRPPHVKVQVTLDSIVLVLGAIHLETGPITASKLETALHELKWTNIEMNAGHLSQTIPRTSRMNALDNRLRTFLVSV